MIVLSALVIMGIVILLFVGEAVLLCMLVRFLFGVVTNLDIVIDVILISAVLLFLLAHYGPRKYTTKLKKLFYS